MSHPSTRAIALPALVTSTLLTAGLLLPTGAVAAPTTGPNQTDRSVSAAPKPAPTRGVLTGRVLTPVGKPAVGLLVRGYRYSDLGPGMNYEQEAPVLARTGADGRFRLKQLTERYLVMVCDAAKGDDQCGSDTSPDRWAPTYLGPDGTSTSWLTQTRMFAPDPAGRALGTITMKRYARLSGTFRGAEAGRSVLLLRGDGSRADRARTDAAGRYSFTVVPGTYRVEADRHEGLRTAATVPGYRSKPLGLTAAEPTTLSFATKPAATVAGVLRSGRTGAGDELVVVTGTDGRFAAAALTDARGRYRIESLKPGRYRVSTTSAYSGLAVAARSVTVRTGDVSHADLATGTGSAIRLRVADPLGSGEVDIEVRDAAGRVAKAMTVERGATLTITGLAKARYTVVVRRAVADPFSDTEQTVFPWTQRSVLLGGGVTDLGRLRLDRRTISVSGTLPKGSQVKITPLPVDGYLRPDYQQGSTATKLAVPWTEQADANGRFTSWGLVPGTYHVTVSTALRNPRNRPSTVGGNVVVTHSTLVVGETSTTVALTAPMGGVLTGRLVHAGSGRPLVAPVGVAVDGGPGVDTSTLFPTVSGPQTYGGGFRVGRLATGPVTATLFDVEAAGERAEDTGTAVPNTLLGSAALHEPRTPYWLTAAPVSAVVTAGATIDVGAIAVTVRR